MILDKFRSTTKEVTAVTTKRISTTFYDLFDGWSDVKGIDQKESTIKYVQVFEEEVKAALPAYEVDFDYQLNTSGPAGFDQFNISADGYEEEEQVKLVLDGIGDKLLNDSASWLVMTKEVERKLILSLCGEAGDDMTDEENVLAGFTANHHPDDIRAAAAGGVQALVKLRHACGLPIF
jgi:hypothetical protein